MSDRLKHAPESAIRFAIRHPRVIGVATLSTALTLGLPTPEANEPPTYVKIGSTDKNIMKQLQENDGATLRGGPSSISAPIGKAPIGERFEVTGFAKNGTWVRVEFNPADPDIELTGQFPVDANNTPIIPKNVYISRSLVKRAPEPKTKNNK